MLATDKLRIKDGFKGERAFILPPAALTLLKESPYSSQLYVTDIGYYPEARNHHRRRDTPVDQHVFILCIDGRGWYEIDGHRYNVCAGDYFILPPGKPHVYAADNDAPWTVCWVHFKGESAHLFGSLSEAPVSLSGRSFDHVGGCVRLFEEIMAVLEKGYVEENLLYSSAVLHHFLSRVRLLSLSPVLTSETDAECGNDVVAHSIRIMNDNVGNTLRIADIARQFGYAPAYFSTLFFRATGMSPVAYQIQLKVKHACRLLDFTTLRVNQICHMVGMSEPYYFTRVFTRIMGVSPRAYRKDKKG